jgi:hypothetical protein
MDLVSSNGTFAFSKKTLRESTVTIKINQELDSGESAVRFRSNFDDSEWINASSLAQAHRRRAIASAAAAAHGVTDLVLLELPHNDGRRPGQCAILYAPLALSWDDLCKRRTVMTVSEASDDLRELAFHAQASKSMWRKFWRDEFLSEFVKHRLQKKGFATAS